MFIRKIVIGISRERWYAAECWGSISRFINRVTGERMIRIQNSVNMRAECRKGSCAMLFLLFD